MSTITHKKSQAGKSQETWFFDVEVGYSHSPDMQECGGHESHFLAILASRCHRIMILVSKQTCLRSSNTILFSFLSLVAILKSKMADSEPLFLNIFSPEDKGQYEAKPCTFWLKHETLHTNTRPHKDHFKDWRQSLSALCPLWRPFLKMAAALYQICPYLGFYCR